MPRKRSTHIIVTYVTSLLVTIALLVSWVVYVVQSASQSESLAQQPGIAEGNRSHWLILAGGCVLFTLLIVGITYLLAQTFAERRYSSKQEEFVSNITHEMKSPVAAIKLHAQTLEQPDVSPEDRLRSVAFILQQADRMGVLVDNVLESSRLLARKKLLKPEPVVLAEFFRAYFDEVRSRVEKQGITLEVHLATDAVVLATVDALHRIMDNLLENAVRFSSRGGEVRCRVEDGAGKVLITVEDDGIGIPKSELTKVFDRFYQIGRQIQERRQGTGLGLSIVSGLVAELKGTVRAQSQEGRPGTRFLIELPTAENAS